MRSSTPRILKTNFEQQSPAPIKRNMNASYHQPQVSNPSATKSLIIINAVIFIAGMYAQQGAVYSIPVQGGQPTSIFEIYGSYSWFNCFIQGEYWRLISYQFLHADLGHVFFNMWALYFFGSAVEQIFGSKRFLIYYLACGVGGALFSSLLAGTGIYHHGVVGYQAQQSVQELANYINYSGVVEVWEFIPLVGASAAVYGIMVAAAFMFPTAQVSLLFPPITLSLRNLSLIVIGIATLTVLMSGSNAGGEAGHLGGILVGAIIMYILRLRYLRSLRSQ